MPKKNNSSKSAIAGFGINVDLHLHDEESFRKIVQSLKELGVSWIRLEICRKKYGAREMREKLASFCQICTSENIRILGLLTEFMPGSIRSVLLPQTMSSSVFEDTRYVNFVDSLVRELGTYITDWEIWNEQNSKRFWIRPPSPKEYVDFAKNVVATIRSIQPNAHCVFGGINGNDVTPLMRFPQHFFYYTNYIHETLKYGIEKHIDSFAFHPYVFSCYVSRSKIDTIISEIQKRIEEMQERYRDFSLLITEIGISPVLNRNITYEEIAKGYKRLISYCQETRIPVCIYTLVDPPHKHYSKLNPDRDFGLLDQNLDPKPLYFELQKSYNRR